MVMITLIPPVPFLQTPSRPDKSEMSPGPVPDQSAPRNSHALSPHLSAAHPDRSTRCGWRTADAVVASDFTHDLHARLRHPSRPPRGGADSVRRGATQRTPSPPPPPPPGTRNGFWSRQPFPPTRRNASASVQRPSAAGVASHAARTPARMVTRRIVPSLPHAQAPRVAAFVGAGACRLRVSKHEKENRRPDGECVESGSSVSLLVTE